MGKTEVSCRLIIWIGLHEIISHVVFNRVLQLLEGLRIAGRSELCHIGFGEVLILFANICGHVNVNNLPWLIHGIEKRSCQIIPGSCFTGAEIEYAVYTWIL